MQNNILDNKILMTIIVAVLSFITVAIWSVAFTSNTSIITENNDTIKYANTFKVSENNFKSIFQGEMLLENKQKNVILTITETQETKEGIEFTYSLKIDFVPVLMNKEGLLAVNNILNFKIGKEKAKYKKLIRILDKSKLEINNTLKKLIIKDKNQKWKIKQI